MIKADGVAVDEKKVKAILEINPPKNVHQVRSFLGMVNYYR